MPHRGSAEGTDAEVEGEKPRHGAGVKHPAVGVGRNCLTGVQRERLG